jgi:DNA-directed RNA polymerase subunit RPC12/RpoP
MKCAHDIVVTPEDDKTHEAVRCTKCGLEKRRKIEALPPQEPTP